MFVSFAPKMESTDKDLVINDSSKMSLIQIPAEIYLLSNLKILYLERNQIEEVPFDFFWCLHNLVWLDLRFNKIQTIPKSIGNHQYLQTVLLQRNQIQELPLEIGLMPKLKNIQLTDNPMIYPRHFILKKGTVEIKKYLLTEYEKMQKEIGEDEFNSDVLLAGTSVPTKLSVVSEQTSIKMPIKSLKNIRKHSDNVQRHTTPVRRPRSVSRYVSYRYFNPNTNIVSKKREEIEVEESFLKQLWLKRLKDFDYLREDIFPKNSNSDVSGPKMKTTKAKRETKCTNLTRKAQIQFIPPMKYDKTVSSREKLHREPDLPKVRQPKDKSKIANVEKLMTDIVNSLQHLKQQRQVQRSHKSQMDIATKEIKKILDLKKRLSALRIVNPKFAA